MGIALTLQSYFGDRHVAYDVMRHEWTGNSSRTAEACHVPGERLAKGVVLKSIGGYILAVLPASKRIAMEAVEKVAGGPVMLASEQEASVLFPDCEAGAVPVFAEAYGIPAVIDEDLDDAEDIYCEGGDHLSLVHMRGGAFRELMSGAERAHFVA